MIGQFGEKEFKEGYQIIKANRGLIYEDNGEEKLCKML